MLRFLKYSIAMVLLSGVFVYGLNNKSAPKNKAGDEVVESKVVVENADDYVDHPHYEEYEAMMAAQESLDEDLSENTADRDIANIMQDELPEKKTEKIEDSQLGTFEIEVMDWEHPVFERFEVKVYVTCKDQVKMIKQRPAPKKEISLSSLKVCGYKGYSYNSQTKTLTIQYLKQSPNASPDDPVCDDRWEQDFVISEACSKWTIR